VANDARRWEADRLVIRVRSSVVVCRVARVTVSWNGCVVIIDVTSCTGNRDMRAGQRESGLTVIKARGNPGGCRVADRAVGGEPGGLVVRVRRTVEICHVAGSTGRRS